MHMLKMPHTAQAPIPLEKLRDYIAYARNNCHPQLSPAAATHITEGYMNMRRMGSSRKVCATSYGHPLTIYISDISAYSGAYPWTG